MAYKSTFGVAPTINVHHEREALAKIVDYCRTHRGEVSVDAINAHLGIDLKQATNKSLVKSIKDNPKIRIVGGKMVYKPTVEGVNDKDDLLRYLREHQWGTLITAIEDAYPVVMDDIEDLAQRRFIVRVTNPEQKFDVLFPRNLNFDDFVADDDIKQLWNAVEVPKNAADLEAALREMGQLSELDAQPTQRIKQARKMHHRGGGGPRKKRRGHISNVHLLDQYDFLQNPGGST